MFSRCYRWLEAQLGSPNMAVYYATKAYLLHFREALVEEVRGRSEFRSWNFVQKPLTEQSHRDIFHHNQIKNPPAEPLGREEDHERLGKYGVPSATSLERRDSCNW
jgi:hypothetical protein